MFRKITVWITALTAIASGALAQPTIFGMWGVLNTSDAIFAGTFNNSGAGFGQYCQLADNSCVYVLHMKMVCQEGEQYPVLLNSDAGSAHLNVLCVGGSEGNPGVYRYRFTDFDTIDGLVKKGLRAGFAFPLQSDHFLLSRFDLRGSNQAIAAMRSAMASKAPSSSAPDGRTTHDEYM